MQRTRKGVSWQFLTCHPCRRGDQICTPTSCFLLSSLAREEAPFFSHLRPQRHRGMEGAESILDCVSATLSNGVQCMWIYLQARARKRGSSYSTEYYSVYVYKFARASRPPSRDTWPPSSGWRASPASLAASPTANHYCYSPAGWPSGGASDQRAKPSFSQQKKWRMEWISVEISGFSLDFWISVRLLDRAGFL